MPDLAAARRAPSFPVSGANGGESLGLDRLAALGVVVTGRLEGFAGDHALFADTLRATWPTPNGGCCARWRCSTPTSRSRAPTRRRADPPPAVAIGAGPRRLDLRGRVSTVLWATGLPPHLPVARRARPRRRTASSCTAQGVTAVPGLYALACASSARRRSHFLGGVGDDAAQIARAIVARAPGARLERVA